MLIRCFPWLITASAAETTSTSSWLESSRRSEEHTSELQSRLHLVCRLLLEKKKNDIRTLRLCRTVDVVFFHDASGHMTTEPDLRPVMQISHVQCISGVIVMLFHVFVRDTCV